MQRKGFFLAWQGLVAFIVDPSMKRTVLMCGGLLALCSVLFLSGCGGRHAETIRKVKTLMDQQQYVPALDELTVAIRQDPKNVELKRLRVMLLIRYERVDMAYAAYADLQKLSPNDQVLMDALRDKDPKVRMGAARVLGFVGTPMAVQSLERLLADPDRDVRRATVSALGEIRDSRATQPLIKALKDEWWFVRSEAAQALGKIRDVAATEPLFAAMNDSDSTAQLSAENALLTISRLPNAPREIFSKYAHDESNPEAQRVALLSLSVMKDHSVVPPLLQLITSSDARKRAQATRALGILQDPAALPAVRKALTDSEAMVRLQAVEALGEFRDVASAGQIKAMVENASESPLVRRSGVVSLMKIAQASQGAPKAP